MTGARGSLGAALLAAFLVAGTGAGAEPVAGTWTDPPSREPVTANAPPPAATPVEPARPAQARDEGRRDGSTRPVRGAAKSDTDTSSAPRARAERPRRVAKSSKARPVARLAERPDRAVSPSRVTERSPEPRRPRVRMADRLRAAARPTLRPTGPFRRRYAGPAWYGAEPADAYEAEDPRFDRLRAAAAAGYIVVRRRSVEFPDGRALRVYRPYVDDEGPF